MTLSVIEQRRARGEAILGILKVINKEVIYPMGHSSIMSVPTATVLASGPAFSRQDHAMCAQWICEQARGDIWVESHAGLFGTLDEAIIITVGRATEPFWLVHKTLSGKAAVQLYPGAATIVATVSDALAVIARAIQRDSPTDNRPREHSGRLTSVVSGDRQGLAIHKDMQRQMPRR